MDGMSLLDVLRGVMLDPAEQAAYNADPNAYLEQYGYDDVDPADLSEAFGLVADTLPADQAQAAMSAAPPSDDATFGTDTADFDGEPGLDDPGVATADAEVDLDVPEPASLEPDDEAGTDPALSFGDGGGDDAADFDDPTFDEGDGALHGPDDDGLAGTDTGLDTGLDDDTGLDAELDDDAGLDVDFGADSIEETDAQYGGGEDDLDDGLDELGDDPGPDDLDIGSF
jgi:hypothetical protein